MFFFLFSFRAERRLFEFQSKLTAGAVTAAGKAPAHVHTHSETHLNTRTHTDIAHTHSDTTHTLYCKSILQYSNVIPTFYQSNSTTLQIQPGAARRFVIYQENKYILNLY